MAATRDSTGVIAQLTRNQHNKHRSQGSPHFPGQFDGNNSTITSFQPEDESTQQFNTAADLPSMASDDSLVGRDDLSRVSVEVGRGAKRGIRKPSYNLTMDMSEERVLDLGDDSLYNLTATPPSRFTNKGADLRRQASVRRATMEYDNDATKTSDIVPTKIRNSKSANRRTLSDLHAKINTISDSSFIIPDPRATSARNTRFAQPRTVSADATIPTRFMAGRGLGQPRTPRRAVSVADASQIGNQTAQSFMLPDLPNITELVAGVKKDGTPIFSKTAKPRSRFTSAGHAKGFPQDGHHPIESLSLPEEEKVIFTSLQLLKEKLSNLEAEKNDAVQRAESAENEVLALRSQVQMERRLRRPDSGLGSDDGRVGSQEWKAQKYQLEASLKTAQDRLERAETKLSNSGSGHQRLTQERDSLVTQLGVAFYSNEELKEELAQARGNVENLELSKVAMQDEIASLHDLNDELSQRLMQSERQHDDNLRQWALREAELKARAKARTKKDDDDRQQRSTSRTAHRSPPGQYVDKISIMSRVEEEIRRARAEAVRQGEISKPRKTSKPRSQSRQDSKKRLSMPTETVSRPHWNDDMDVASEMDGPQFEEEDSRDITYLSMLDANDLATLRRKLEAERLASKQQGTGPKQETARDTAKDIRDHRPATVARNVRILSPGTADHISYSTPEDVGDVSILSTASRRPQRSKSFEEMTSAFILPDITMKDLHQTGESEGPAGRAQVPMRSTDHDIDVTAATVRPSQSPKRALATVMNQLQDEIVDMKKQLGECERQYEGHDPAMGQRKRVTLKEKMQGLISEIEKRSEQVYGLHDVVEAQRKGEASAGDGSRRRLPRFEEDVESVDIVEDSAAF